MKFQVERDVLANAVAWTARALPARPAVPVLAGMHLAAAQQLTLSTFDYEVSAQATVPVITDEEGTVLVSGRLLAEIVRSLPARPVEMSTEGTRTTLKCGSAVFTLMTLPDDEYPTLPGMPPEAGVIGADVLASAISQVAIAAGRDDTLPALTGIRMEFAGDTVTLVATDRYRLAVRELHWQPGQAGRVGRGPGAVAGPRGRRPIADDGCRGVHRPDRARRRRFPGRGHHRVRRGRPADHDAAARRRVSAVPDATAERVQRRRGASRRTVCRGGQAGVSGGRAEYPRPAGVLRWRACAGGGAGDEAQAVETLEASFDGEDLQIAFNPQYLLDGLSAIDSDAARISFTTPTRPAVVTGKRGEDGPPDYRYVLMPIRSAG